MQMNFLVSWLIICFSTNFKEYLTLGSSRVIFFFFLSRSILAKIAVTATTPTPTATGIAFEMTDLSMLLLFSFQRSILSFWTEVSRTETRDKIQIDAQFDNIFAPRQFTE